MFVHKRHFRSFKAIMNIDTEELGLEKLSSSQTGSSQVYKPGNAQNPANKSQNLANNSQNHGNNSQNHGNKSQNQTLISQSQSVSQSQSTYSSSYNPESESPASSDTTENEVRFVLIFMLVLRDMILFMYFQSTFSRMRKRAQQIQYFLPVWMPPRLLFS